MVRRILSDSQWARVAHLLPGKDGDPGRSARDNREFLEAVLWIARTGSPWRDLPDEFGLWNSVFQHFRAPVPWRGVAFLVAIPPGWVYVSRHVKKLRSLIPLGQVFTEFLSRKPDPLPLRFSVYRLC